MNFKTSKYIIISSEGYDTAEGCAFYIVFSTRTCEVFWLTPEYTAMLISGNVSGLPEDVFKELLFAEIIIPAAEQELDLVIKRSQAAVADDKTLRYAIKYSTADLERAISEIGQLLSGKKYKKLLLEWQGGWPAEDFLAVGAFTHQLKKLVQNYSCVYEAELNITSAGDAMSASAADYGITAINLMLECDTEVQLSGQVDTICKSIRAAGNAPAIHLIVSAINYIEKAIIACIDVIKEHNALNRLSISVSSVQASASEAGNIMTVKAIAAREMEALHYLASHGIRPQLLPTHRAIRFFSVKPGDQPVTMLASACANCNLLPVCGGAAAEQWSAGRIPCPAFLYNAGQRLLLNYTINC